METIPVFNLADSKERLTFVGPDMTPTDAVIAAYAQSLGDYDTFDYQKKYGHLVTSGRQSVRCENYATWNESRYEKS